MKTRVAGVLFLVAVVVAGCTKGGSPRSAVGPSGTPSGSASPAEPQILERRSGVPVPGLSPGVGAAPPTTAGYPTGAIAAGGAAPRPPAPQSFATGGGPAYDSAVGPYPYPYYGGSPADGLSVSHTQTFTRPADRAAIVASRSYDPSRPRYSDDERSKITTELGAIGIASSDVSFTSAPYQPNAIVTVAVPLDQLPSIGDRVVGAIEKAAGRPEQASLRFDLADCQGALDQMRREALAKAKEKADALARAASVTLGPIVGLSEQASGQQFYGYDPKDPCATDSQGGGYAGPSGGPGSQFAFDADREVRINEFVSVVYGLGAVSASDRTIRSSGTGSVTARADGARIVVAGSKEYGPNGAGPVTKEQRDKLATEIESLGVARSDIDINSPGYGGPLQVTVRASLDRVKTLGLDIVHKVNDVTPQIVTQGVAFTHSNCEPIRRAATEQALSDARTRAEPVATAAGLKVGAVRSLSESGYYGPYGSSGGDCDVDPAAEPYYYGQVQPFDADPVIDLGSAVSVAYLLDG